MFNYQTVTQGSAGTSDWIFLDPSEDVWSVSVQADHNATCTYSLEVTCTPVSSIGSATAIELSTATDKTESVAISIVAPVTAVRVNITSYTSGDGVTLHVRQSGKGVNPGNPQA